MQTMLPGSVRPDGSVGVVTTETRPAASAGTNWPPAAASRDYLKGGPSPPTAPIWTWSPEVPNSEAGRSIAGLGDVDGETRDDVAIGAAGHPNCGFTGMVFAFRGEMWGLTAAPMWSRGATLGDRFGELVLGVDHVVSGISPCLLVGTPTATGQFTDEGIEVVTDGPLPDDTRIDLSYDVE